MLRERTHTRISERNNSYINESHSYAQRSLESSAIPSQIIPAHISYADFTAPSISTAMASMPDNEGEIVPRINLDDGLETQGVCNAQRDEEEAEPQRDYLHFAELYRVQRKYLASRGQCHELCVLCERRRVAVAFFPCEHRCVCWECVIEHDIREYDRKVSKTSSHFNCPLCATVIKKMFPMRGGLEVEDYWKWCNEVPPKLPSGFEKRFNLTADILQNVNAPSSSVDFNLSQTCSTS